LLLKKRNVLLVAHGLFARLCHISLVLARIHGVCATCGTKKFDHVPDLARE